MTFPQSGPSYGQGESGQGQQYGSGQQYGTGQYGQSQYGQQPQYGQGQYSSQQYGQQPQYGQPQYEAPQYGQPQYEAPQYQAPKPPSQGLPHNTVQILTAAVGALGVVMLFLGFLPAYKQESFRGATESVKVFETHYATAWGLFAVAGVAALLTFLVGAGKQYVAAITSLSVIAALITIFQFAGVDTGSASNGVGGILLLVFTIVGALLSVAWLLIEAEMIKTAPAPAAQAAGVQAGGVQTGGAHAAPAVAYGDQSSAGGYAQSTSSAASSYGQPTPAYGDASASTYGSGAAPSLGDASASSYGSGAATYGQTSAAEGDATTYTPLPDAAPSAPGNGSETTVFGAPETPEEPKKDS